MVESPIYKNSCEDRAYLSDYGDVKDGAKEHASIRMEGRRAYQKNRSVGPGGEKE